MSENKAVNRIIDYVNLLNRRQIDTKIAQIIYNLEVKAVSLPNKPTRYLIPRISKRKYFSSFIEKNIGASIKYQALPRYSYDLRDCEKLMLDCIKKYGNISINSVGENTYTVRLKDIEMKGELAETISKVCLANVLYEKLPK